MLKINVCITEDCGCTYSVLECKNEDTEGELRKFF